MEVLSLDCFARSGGVNQSCYCSLPQGRESQVGKMAAQEVIERGSSTFNQPYRKREILWPERQLSLSPSLSPFPLSESLLDRPHQPKLCTRSFGTELSPGLLVFAEPIFGSFDNMFTTCLQVASFASRLEAIAIASFASPDLLAGSFEWSFH